MSEKCYVAIDLKSFYASVECVERGLDPLNTNLVVADGTRTEKTICLAVSPSLKSYGVPSRPRLFEVVQCVSRINSERRMSAPGRKFVGESYDHALLSLDSSYAVGYITAPPRMALYMEYSTRIYGIYLKYFAPEDIHVYSIDEVFIDITPYMFTYRRGARELVRDVLRDILENTGITATAGIGTNLYLAKVAMDIIAKRIRADSNGSRIAILNEESYRRLLWEHRPLTDFWRVGRGYTAKLEAHGMYTMGDIALMSEKNEALLYKLFGINAELLIDHAWGWEPCTIGDIKAYKPDAHCLSSGQVLHEPYGYDAARLVTREMCDLLALDMAEKGLFTRQLTLTVGYDAKSLDDGFYEGEISIDYYGRAVPRHAHGTVNLSHPTSSSREICEGVDALFSKIVDEGLLVRRINICACGLVSAEEYAEAPRHEQRDFFSMDDEGELRREREEREHRRQLAVSDIKRRFGKNAILRGMNFESGATAIDRNMQIGGHKA